MLNYEDAPNEGYYYTTIKWFNGKIKAPKKPSRVGFYFKGWYKDEACTEKWDFKSDRTRILPGKKIVLYAKWEERYYA